MKKIIILVLAALSAKGGDWYVESWRRPMAVLKHDGKVYAVSCSSSTYSHREGKEWKHDVDNSCGLAPMWVGQKKEDGWSSPGPQTIADYGSFVSMIDSNWESNYYTRETYTVLSVEIYK